MSYNGGGRGRGRPSYGDRDRDRDHGGGGGHDRDRGRGRGSRPYHRDRDDGDRDRGDRVMRDPGGGGNGGGSNGRYGNGGGGGDRGGNGGGNGGGPRGAWGRGPPGGGGERRESGSETARSRSPQEDTRERSGSSASASSSRGGRAGRGRGTGKRKTYEERVKERLDAFESVVSRTNVPITLKQGSEGMPVSLTANYFPVTTPDWIIRHYRVDFVPDIERDTRLKKTLVRRNREVLPAYIFDGSSLWSSREIQSPLILTCIENEQPYEITIRRITEWNPTDPTVLQIYNIIVRKCQELMDLEEIGRYYYNRNEANTELRAHQIELWPGYKITMRQHEHAILLGVEITHKVLRTDSCLDFMRRNMRDRQALSEQLVGCTVITHYNRRTYRVDDIEWDKTPLSTFDLRDGTQITFADYYRNKGFPIRDMQQPLLSSRPKKKDFHRGQLTNVLLIPELCNMTGLTDEQRGNFTFMRNFTQQLQMTPGRRVAAIKRFMDRLRNVPETQQELKRWELEFGTDLVKVPGRVQPAEEIKFGDNSKDPAKYTGPDWTRGFFKNTMFSTIELRHWVIIVPARDAQNMDNFVRTLKRVGSTMNFDPQRPLEVIRINDIRIPSYLSAIEQAMANHKGRLQMVCVILPNNSLDTYAAVKRLLSIDYGIPSQCVVAKNSKEDKKLMSIATKIAIQMNAKLGGEPWLVPIPLKKLMIMGFDVHHSGKGKNKRSVGALVATTNDNHGRYYSTVSYHGNHEELSSNLCTDFTKCLHAYQKVNGYLPDRIILYRDGVGEGQLGYVYSSELAQIKVAITSTYSSSGGREPKFTFIVVTKRINTRIFAQTQRDLENPLPGTVVDDVITLPERFDFYLISQKVSPQTTVSPTAYNVLDDSQGLSASKLQRLTFKLTHMYYNWMGTVAVPAPCQYAHKLAFLTGTALLAPSNESLSHKLHFL